MNHITPQSGIPTNLKRLPWNHAVLPLWCLTPGIMVPCPGGIRCGREFRRHRLAHEALKGSAPRNVQPPGL
jgi:hypothetical protein